MVDAGGLWWSGAGGGRRTRPRRILVTTFVQGEDALDQDEEIIGELFAVFAECPGAARDG